MPKGIYDRTQINAKRNSNRVKIDGEAYKQAIKNTGFTPSKISTAFLGRDNTYLSHAFCDGRIDKDAFAKINNMFSLNGEDYIVEETPADYPEPAKPQNVSVSVDTSKLEEKLDSLIKAIEGLTTVELDTRKKLNSLENALGKIVQNTQLSLEHQDIDLDSIDDGISKVNSSLNIIKGRLDDINKKGGK